MVLQQKIFQRTASQFHRKLNLQYADIKYNIPSVLDGSECLHLIQRI